MKSNKILSIAVIALIILNLVLIGFIWFKRPDRGDRRHPHAFRERMLSKQLNFTKEQEKSYQSLISEFRKNQSILGEKIFQSRKLLHESIFDPSINADSLMIVIGNLEKEHAKELWEHQRNIYNICNKDQKEIFNKLTHQTIRFKGRERGMRDE